MYCQKDRNSSSYWCRESKNFYIVDKIENKSFSWCPWETVGSISSMFGCWQTWGCHMHNRNHSFPSNPFEWQQWAECGIHRMHSAMVCLPPLHIPPLSISNQINTAGLMGKTWREEGINRFCRGTKGPSPQIEMARELSWEELRSF